MIKAPEIPQTKPFASERHPGLKHNVETTPPTGEDGNVPKELIMGSNGSPSSPVRSRRREADENTSIGIAFGGMVPIAAAALLVAARGHIENTNVALLLTVVVVAAAAFGGRAAGATAAVSAAMSFNFFHTRPYLSLKIDSSDDVETTVLLLVVGMAVGQLARRAQSASTEVKTSRSELDRIRRLADEVARGIDTSVVLHDAEAQLAELLDLEACHFEEAPYHPGPALPSSNGTEPSPGNATGRSEAATSASSGRPAR